MPESPSGEARLTRASGDCPLLLRRSRLGRAETTARMKMRTHRRVLLVALFAAFVSDLQAATYTVGGGGQYPDLNSLFAAVDLGPGDVVDVAGGAIYAGNVIVPEEDGG